jgi:hypothetical protein
MKLQEASDTANRLLDQYGEDVIRAYVNGDDPPELDRVWGRIEEDAAQEAREMVEGELMAMLDTDIEREHDAMLCALGFHTVEGEPRKGGAGGEKLTNYRQVSDENVVESKCGSWGRLGSRRCDDPGKVGCEHIDHYRVNDATGEETKLEWPAEAEVSAP